jgi:hypothetical protein
MTQLGCLAAQRPRRLKDTHRLRALQAAGPWETFSEGALQRPGEGGVFA